MSLYGEASYTMEVSPANPAETVMESQVVQQKSIASFFSVQKGTSAHEITPASVLLAKTAARSAAKAKEAKAAAKADAKVTTKASAKKNSSKIAMETKATFVIDSEADDKCVKSYFPGAYFLCTSSSSSHHVPVLLTTQEICLRRLWHGCCACFSGP